MLGIKNAAALNITGASVVFAQNSVTNTNTHQLKP